MNIFDKGKFNPITLELITGGIASLEELTKFQKYFQYYDTDTVINLIRDACLGFDLVNFEKHGFDAKKSNSDIFLW